MKPMVVFLGLLLTTNAILYAHQGFFFMAGVWFAALVTLPKLLPK